MKILKAGEIITENTKVRMMGEWVSVKNLYNGWFIGQKATGVKGDWVFALEEEKNDLP